MDEQLPEIPYRAFDELPSLPFSQIRELLDDLLTATINLLQRRWPVCGYPSELQTILVGTVKITDTTYRTVRYICADLPEDHARRLEFAVSVPPLARSVLDSLFNVVFLLDSPADRLAQFHKSGWREIWAEYQRLSHVYGCDARWTDELKIRGQFVEHARRLFGISEEEATNPSSIKWWPNPGKMPGATDLSKSKAQFLRYLNDWFYRELSADAHLSWPGFSRRATHLLDPNENRRLNNLRKFKSDCVMTTITIMLSLLSEIEMEFGFGRAGRLAEVWAKLDGVWGEADEIYRLRYETGLRS